MGYMYIKNKAFKIPMLLKITIIVQRYDAIKMSPCLALFYTRDTIVQLGYSLQSHFLQCGLAMLISPKQNQSKSA